MSDWQPINSAPRDVAECLLWCSDRTYRRDGSFGERGALFGRIEDGRPYGDGLNGDWTFTHWQPAPEKPA